MTETELTTMMAIVQYTDGCLYTCKFTDIDTKRRNLHSVKYQDQKQYAGRILIFGADRAMLDQLHSHFQGDVPFVRFKSLVHTGICLTSSQILQQAKKLPADGKKLYINELIAPSYDSMDAECFRFDVDKDFSHNGKNEKFFEAVLFAEKAETQVLETNQPTYEKSQLPESSSVDISSIENGNHSNRTNSGKECEEDRKSSNTANIDSFQITPAAAVAFTQCQTDLCKDYKDGYVFSNVMEIDSSKPPASSNGIFTTCDVYSTKESKVDPESWNTAAILQETENMPEDISSMNNGDDAKRIVCGKECDKNLKSSNIAEIDSFQLTPAATAMFTQCQTDSGKEHSDGRAFLNVTEIDSPEFATTLIGILTTGATDSSKESKVDPKSAKVTGVDRTTMSSYAKPKIISNDPVEFGIIRIPFNADSTYHVDSLSVIGAELDQDSSMLQDLHSHMMNGLPIDEALNSAIPSEDVINGLKSYNSYEDHFPVMSSTIVESTTMNSLKDVIEGE